MQWKRRGREARGRSYDAGYYEQVLDRNQELRDALSGLLRAIDEVKTVQTLTRTQVYQAVGHGQVLRVRAPHDQDPRLRHARSVAREVLDDLHRG